MTPFVDLVSIAAPLPESDLDTDVIFPARFLLLLDRRGLAVHLFHERRGAAGEPFVLDRPPFDRAQILVAGANFGCGSSREQAVWALADFGLRAIVAPSFGEIFQTNCFRNGVLPVTLEVNAHRVVIEAAGSGEPMEISLARQSIRLCNGQTFAFALDPGRRRDLMLGRDEIGAILADDADSIAAFERGRKTSSPWLNLSEDQLAYLHGLGGADL